MAPSPRARRTTLAKWAGAAALVVAAVAVAAVLGRPQTSQAGPSTRSVDVTTRVLSTGDGGTVEVPRLLLGPLSPPAPGLQPAAAAQRYLDDLRRRSPELVPAELGPPDVAPLGSGHVVRYAQRHHGVPVLGGELVMRVGPDGQVLRLLRDVLEPAELANVASAPALTAAQARRKVADLKRGDTGAPTLVVDLQSRRLVWQVPVVDLARLENAFYLVDAIGGDVVRRIERLQFANQFKVYQANPVVMTAPTSQPLPGGAPFTPQGMAPRRLSSQLLTGYNCLDEKTTRMVPGIPVALHLCEPRQTALSSPGFDWDGLMPLVNATDGKCPLQSDADKNAFAEAHMYWHAAVVYDRFRLLFNNLGQADFRLRMSAGVGARPFPLLVNLCMPDLMNLAEATNPNAPLKNFDNAFFSPGDVNGGFSRILLGQDGDMIAFGMGSKVNFSLDGDVVYHEFTHAVVHARGRLREAQFRDLWGLNVDPGAMNEGLSDFFSSGITADPALGEYAQKNLPVMGEGLRNLDNELHCSDDRIGEVHEDARAYAGALWRARKAIAGDPKDASPAARARRDRFDQAVLAALDGSGAMPSMTDMAKLTLQEVKLLAADLGADAEAKLTQAFTHHGVLPQCDRIIKKSGPKRALCLDGDGRTLTPGHVQWRVEVPGTADTIEVNLETVMGSCTAALTLGQPPEPKLQLAVRAGDAPVAWDMTGKGTYDKLVDLVQTGSRWEAKLPMARGVYHLMIVNTGGGTIGRSINVATSCSLPQGCETATPDMASSGTDPTPDEMGQGCSCRVTGAETPAAARIGIGIGLALALGLLRRRRRA